MRAASSWSIRGRRKSTASAAIRRCATLPEPVEHAMVIVPAAGVADVLTDAKAAGVKSATVYAGAVGDGEDPESKKRGAWLKEFLAETEHARRRPQLHGGAQLPGAAVRLSEHGIVQRAARLGRLRVPVRRHAAVLAAHRRRPGPALLLRHHVRATRPISISPTISTSWSTIRTPASSRCSSRASGGRRRSCMRPAARSKPASRSWRSRPAPPRSRKRRRNPTPASSAATMRPISPCASATASAIAARSTTWWRPRSPSRAAGCRKGRASASSPPRAARSICCSTMRSARAPSSPEFSAATNAALLPFMQEGIVPKNPLDLGIPSTLEHAAAVCEVVARDPNVDMLGWAAMLPSKPGAWDGVGGAAQPAQRDRQAGDRLRPHELSDAAGIGRRPGGRRLSVPAGAGADAAGHECACGSTPQRQGRAPAMLPPAPASDLSPATLDATLARYGIALPESRAVATAAEAEAAAAAIGFPVALKIRSPDILHKTEAGGVRARSAQPRGGAARPPRRCSRPRAPRHPDARIDGFLVQEMAAGRRGHRRRAQRSALRPAAADRRRRHPGRARPRRGAAAPAGHARPRSAP